MKQLRPLAKHRSARKPLDRHHHPYTRLCPPRRLQTKMNRDRMLEYPDRAEKADGKFTGTDEAGIQLIRVSQTRVSQLLLTLIVPDDWNVDFLQDVLVLAEVTERVFAPARRPAARPTEVGVSIRQARRTDVRAVDEVDRAVQLQDGQVVVQCSRVIFRMHVDGLNVSFDVREEFNVVIYVPFSQANAQIISRVGLDTMRGGDDVEGIDQCTAAHVNRLLWILLQNGHLPWIFAEFAVAINVDRSLDAAGDSLRVSLAALAWRNVRTRWTTAAHLRLAALLRDLVERLPLEENLHH